jgi:COP9 signalosome complex subunit 5
MLGLFVFTLWLLVWIEILKMLAAVPTVMGLMLGRPDPHSPTTLIVTDAFPLPIEGFETRVIADDQAVVNHMISLNECLERTRNERFMGWYHSHPFDLGDLSHCFLSQTDLSTQLQWQRAEDPHGNPFVAIVLDPLRSNHLGTPQLKAFRAYPPEYQSSIPNECPDGSIETSEQARLEKWGSCWNRYYELGIEYFMSSTSRNILGDLTQNYLWMTSFKRKDELQHVKQLQEAAQGTVKATIQSGTLGGGIAVASNTSGGGSSSTSSNALFAGAPSISGVGGSIVNANDFAPTVDKLQDVATQELVQSTMRQVHSSIFKIPACDCGMK